MSALRVAVIGLGGIGRAHAKGFADVPEFELAAGCDRFRDRLEAFGRAHPGAAAFEDAGRMLREVRPDVAVVATGTSSHAALVLAAAGAGVKGIYCEKPMAVNLGEARAEVEACERRGVALAVNHQRRTSAVYVAMRRMIEAGAIGRVSLVRGGCAGDMLSDGTHAVDSVRHLLGDEPAVSVTGEIDYRPPDPDEPRSEGYDVSGGYRYGHPVESGAATAVLFASGARAELLTGARQPKGRRYQDLEVVGETGALWRAGDQADPPLLVRAGAGGAWQPAPVEGIEEEAAFRGAAPRETYRRFARMVLEGADHPLAGSSALRDQEIVMAVYESARRGGTVTLPLAEERYPLAVMIEEGRFGAP